MAPNVAGCSVFSGTLCSVVRVGSEFCWEVGKKIWGAGPVLDLIHC